MTLPFALNDVIRITAYKRDEITTDLICWDIELEGPDGVVCWTRHEETPDWKTWVESLSVLPDFDKNWFSKVSQPPFALSQTVIFDRLARVETPASKD